MDSEEYVNRVYRQMIRDYRRLERGSVVTIEKPIVNIVQVVERREEEVVVVVVGKKKGGSLRKILPRRMSRNVLDLFNQQTK